MLQVSQAQAGPDRPPCWGRSYNNEDQGCSACMFRITCRDEIIRSSKTMQAPSSPQANYFNFFGQPTQQSQFYRSPNTGARPFSPSPITPVTPARQPVVVAQQPVPPMQALAQAAQQVPYSKIGWYGSIPDSMWGAVASVPPIFRPQMHGETFLIRLAKNTALVLGEIMCRELMLAFRQAILPPPPPGMPSAAEQVVDVSPKS